jgi:primosomal protein N' (replication factor Y) (superfamily II helicase)
MAARSRGASPRDYTRGERLHYDAMPLMSCEVALPVPLRSTFTYLVPESLAERAVVGARVLVPFRNRALVGVIVEEARRAPEGKTLKELQDVLDPAPALPPRVAELGRWVANYYLAPEGEVFRGMLPPQIDLRADRELRVTPAGAERRRALAAHDNRSEAEVDELALLRLAEIEGKPVRADRIGKLPGGTRAAESLLRRGMLEAREVARRRKPRTQRIVAWGRTADGADAIPGTEIERRLHQVLSAETGPLPFAELLRRTGVSRTAVERLIGNSILASWEEPLAPIATSALEIDEAPPSHVLNADQLAALGEIRGWIESRAFTVGLLHGVTGSGKTEVYLGAVEAALAQGRTALVLVPEIALTLWMGRVCRARFGAIVAVLHSGLPDVERVREWWRVRSGEARVVVGTRSAVFAPLENLGIVIVDEEQEPSYKQEETPRYHGRDVAVVRAKMESAVALLGSATPSMETFHHAQKGRYRLLQLGSRVENRPMAAVEIVDLRDDFRQTHSSEPISGALRAAIARRLGEGTQSLMLVNRRGYSWYALCRSCGASLECAHCSIALTYHKARGRLECHYCGYSRVVPKNCPKCESKHLYFVGAGAEQLEERLKTLFPAARIGRLDRDTARQPRMWQQLLGAFADGRIDILVGTQMVAKGHDFHRVTLVGVVSADTQLGLPDFRAAERTFELLTQVAGRAGRGELPGQVLVETYHPEHYAIALAAQQDYLSFYEKELHYRRMMHYPPFAALASILVRDARLENAVKWSREIERFFAGATTSGVRVLGPAPAPLARLRKEFRFQFLLKSPKRTEMGRLLRAALDHCTRKEIPQKAVLVDVDPLSLM